MKDDRATLIHNLALSHGQVRGVLWELGLRVGDSESQFDAWLKYVRRMGVPFYPDELGRGAGFNIIYKFHHVMELAIALALRTQGILPRDLLGVLARNRDELRSFYDKAYTECDCGLGALIEVPFADEALPRVFQGIFLDLRLDYIEGGPLTCTEPRLLGPKDAILRFMESGSLQYPRPPLPLSRIASDVMRLAENAPELRRGRQ